jgi:hypothetical protein
VVGGLRGRGGRHPSHLMPNFRQRRQRFRFVAFHTADSERGFGGVHEGMEGYLLAGLAAGFYFWLRSSLWLRVHYGQCIG